MSTRIEQSTGYDPALYNQLIQEAAQKNVSSATVDAALLQAIDAGKSFTEAVKQVQNDLPILAPANTSNINDGLKAWSGLASASPCALMAALLIKDSAESHRQNRDRIMAEGENIAQKMEEEADKLEEGAMQKFWCAVAANAATIATSAGSMAIAGGAGKTGNMSNETRAAFAQANSAIGSGIGGIINAGGDYAQAMRQSEAKKIEADQERLRTAQELLKQHNEQLRDVIAKALDFMNSMQANMNQTRARILG
ncbi:MAG: hypothetical protein II967_00905 [Deltaproteobacteria bacterium]|nr:hypothetical protein [Deltaproteobacteria bacterium]